MSILRRKVNKEEISDIADIFKAAKINPKHIVDGGAYIGFVTHRFLEEFDSATVYSFEPNPQVYKQLAEHYKNNDRVVSINAGIGSETGEMKFQVNNRAVTSSFLPPNDFHKMNIAGTKAKFENVKITTIDDALEPYGVDHIDILKLDIEGYEIEGFKGIENIGDRVSMIFAEVNLIPNYEGQPLVEDIIIYLKKYNFHIVNFYGIIENEYHQASVTNLLFISEAFKHKLRERVGEKYFGY